jgi:hypothetical protein
VPILYRRPGKVAFLALLAERKINNLRGINTPLEFDSVPGRHLYSFIFSNFQAICANRNNGRTVDAGFGRYFFDPKKDSAVLSVYTCHYPLCDHTDIHHRRCRCPNWIQGLLDDKFIRVSAGMRIWENAELKPDVAGAD